MPLASMQKQSLKAALLSESTFSTTLLAICLDAYGTEMLEWDPRTLWMSLADDYGVEVPPINKDKLQAITLVYTTNLPFISVETFSHVCNVLSGSEANFHKWDMVTPDELIWGVYEMMLNIQIDRVHGEKSQEFSHEVRRYMGIILNNDGIFDPPDVLRVAEMPSRASLDQWEDDPEMFNAAHDHAQTEKRQLMESLARRLLEFITEMNNIVPLLGDYESETWLKFKSAVERGANKLLAEHSETSLART